MSDMENRLRVACLQMNSGNDLAGNLAEAERYILEAAEKGAEFVLLPENAFFMRGADGDSSGDFTTRTHPGLILCRELARRHGLWLLAGSVFVAAGPEHWHNRSILIRPDGSDAALYDKIHLFDVTLPGGESYRESDRIAPGDRLASAELPWGRLGLSVCYDLRFPHLYRDLAKAGASMFSIPSAFTHTTGKAHWHMLLRARAIENGAFVLAPAQCGAHPGGRRTYGHSLIAGPWGDIVAEADETTPGVLLADLDLSKIDEARAAIPCLKHDRPYV